MTIPFMPMYWGAYTQDTAHLTTVQHGAYLLLIGHYWSTGGLPGDDVQMAAITRQSIEAWRAMKPTLAAFFRPGWIHGRIEFEIAKAIDKIEKRKAAGKKGGEASGQARRVLAWEANASNHIQKKEQALRERTIASRSKWFDDEANVHEAMLNEANTKQNVNHTDKESKKETNVETGALADCGKQAVFHSATENSGNGSAGELATALPTGALARQDNGSNTLLPENLFTTLAGNGSILGRLIEDDPDVFNQLRKMGIQI